MKQHLGYVMGPGIAAALLLLIIADSGRAEDKALFDFGAGFSLEKVKVNPGAKLSTVREGDRQVPHVETDHEHPWPGIELRCPLPAGHWDLSAFSRVEVELRNPTDSVERLAVRVDSPGADGVSNCCGEGIELAPRSRGVVRVELRRRAAQGAKIELFGMNGYPPGVKGQGSKDSKPDQGTLDAAEVTNIVLFAPKPAEDLAFEVLAVRAAGTYELPSPLLDDPGKFFPFIDTFGQYEHRDWPGKTHSLQDLAAARDREARELDERPAPASFDRFGGWKDGPALKATGSFYAAKNQGTWWLVDPDGRLFFSQGIDSVSIGEGATPVDGRATWFADLPSPDSEFKNCYFRAFDVVHGHYQGQHPLCFDFARLNLMRKYGKDWHAISADLAHRRLRNWGLNTLGNWSSPDVYLKDKTPYTVGINSGGRMLEGSNGYWGKFHDVFDPQFAASIRTALARQKETTANDPWCVGYFVDNEISWGNDGISLAVAALASPADQPAKMIFVDNLKTRYGTIDKLNATWSSHYESWDALLASTTPPDVKGAGEDLSAFYSKFAEAYFRSARDAVKAEAPNHLYLGCRFAWMNAAAVAAAARYCDVVSFNIYHRTPTERPLPLNADVPVLIGEFHLGALDRGLFHPGLVPVESQADRAAAYKGYVEAALRDERMVGCHWFQYADEPTTGRFYDGENYQIGFIDVADTPYAETVQAARQVGDEMYRLRDTARR
jgi:hypothetical protein